MSKPQPIEITFTKDDLRQAGPFTEPTECLICTALTRLGYHKPNVGPTDVVLRGQRYYIPPRSPGNPYKYMLKGSEEAPFYDAKVVGKTIKLKPVRNYED